MLDILDKFSAVDDLVGAISLLVVGGLIVFGWVFHRKQFKTQQKLIENILERLQKLEDDPGYEILTYWDEDGSSIGREMNMAMRGAGVYRYPRTIFSKKTGSIQEIPFPGDKAKHDA